MKYHARFQRKIYIFFKCHLLIFQFSVLKTKPYPCRVPVSFVCSCILGVVWLFLLETPDTAKVPNYDLGVVCFAMSSILHMMSAPLFVIGQKCMFVKLKVSEARSSFCQGSS